jgi:hypothetical protein
MLPEVLPHPSPVLVSQAAETFEAKPATALPARALALLFRHFPANMVAEEVQLKVAALNALYNTNVYDLVGLAEHIVTCRIDPLLQAGESTAVDLISRAPLGRDRKPRNVFAFATKYCSWHNPEVYPIFDSYVESLLAAYRRQDGFAKFRTDGLRQFARFKGVIEEFRSFYGLQGLPLRSIDRFLWLTGRKLAENRSTTAVGQPTTSEGQSQGETHD